MESEIKAKVLYDGFFSSIPDLALRLKEGGYFAIDFEESQDLQKLIELEGYNAMLVEVDVFAPSVTFLSYISETRTKIGTNVKLIGINTSDFMVSPVSALFYIAHGMDAVVRIPNIETLVSMGLANPDLFTKEKGTHWMVPNEMLKRKLREILKKMILRSFWKNFSTPLKLKGKFL